MVVVRGAQVVQMRGKVVALGGHVALAASSGMVFGLDKAVVYFVKHAARDGRACVGFGGLASEVPVVAEHVLPVGAGGKCGVGVDGWCAR